jgi:hypothetical protein
MHAPAAVRGAAPSAPGATPRVPFHEVLGRAAAAAAPVHAPAGGALPGLEAVEQVRARLDHALAQARAGRTFSPQELLALQADAYRYQQTVELASKVAEAGAQTVRQAVNTQV